jgi:8-oxo-dGTP pyrophosphatase MutT (NUDIX family)
MTTLQRSGPIVVAAVCYRRGPDGSPEFLLVRTRNGRWTFPKGRVDDDPDHAAAAAREAYEEAGVHGKVEPSAFTWYVHSKSEGREHAVYAHLCEVRYAYDPAESHRVPTWFVAEQAKQRLRQKRSAEYAAELERVVDLAVFLLQSHRSR